MQGLKPKKRRVLMDLATKDQIKALEEVALNIVKNTVALSDDEERVCRRWRKPLRLLALKRYPSKDKKKILQQGGFFAAILPIIASVLGSLISQ
jgi:hypothetical protein